MIQRLFIIILLLDLFYTSTLFAKNEDSKKAGKQNGNLVSSILLLELAGEIDQSVIDTYSACYNALKTKDYSATFADVSASSEVQAVVKKHNIHHLGGPMLGVVSSEGARVWLRTVRPASVEVHITVKGENRIFGPVESTNESDLVAIVPVTGLGPNTSHPYAVFVDGYEITIPGFAVIPTSPVIGKPSKVRITFGTCFHRWGLSNQAQADTLIKRKPNALLVYGDIAVQDRYNLLSMHRADYLLRDFHKAWQTMACTVPTYAAWDDHDYFANDKSGIPEGYKLKDKQGVCDVFTSSWNNPSNGFNDERRGIFFHTQIGPCDVIMLDNRYFRVGEKKNPKEFLGKEQTAWLKQELLACKGAFIIISCGTMWSDYVSNGKDSWGVWDPNGREELFQFIEKNHIGGVMFISGDRHGARGFTIPRPNGFKFYEFEAASMGGRSGAPSGDNPFYLLKGQYAFGEFSIDATLEDPKVTFRLVRDTGEIHHEMTLSRSQLTP